MKKLTISLLLSSLLYGNNFDDGVNYYQQQDYKKAFTIFHDLANEDNVNAQYNLALMYEKGIGVEKSDILSFVWYDIAAQNGNIYAQNKLGTLYAKGDILGTPDKVKAIEKYLESAKGDYALAQYNLAVTYHDDLTQEKVKKALFWYEKAHKNGNVAATNNLANLYYNGQGVTKDLKKAFELYTEASEKNDALALYNLGMMYYLGEYVKQDENHGLELIFKSAKLSNHYAQIQLGKFYLSGTEILEKDYKKALTWFYEAAKQDDASAQYYLGICFFYGYGVQSDPKKAAFWLDLASQKGYVHAKTFMQRNNLTYY